MRQIVKQTSDFVFLCHKIYIYFVLAQFLHMGLRQDTSAPV